MSAKPEARIAFQVAGGAAIYQMPLSLASGSTKHFRTFISVDYPGTIDARIVAGGREIATQQASINNTVSGLLVGVASDQASALDAVATVHPGGVRAALRCVKMGISHRLSELFDEISRQL